MTLDLYEDKKPWFFHRKSFWNNFLCSLVDNDIELTDVALHEHLLPFGGKYVAGAPPILRFDNDDDAVVFIVRWSL